MKEYFEKNEDAMMILLLIIIFGVLLALGYWVLGWWGFPAAYIAYGLFLWIMSGPSDTSFKVVYLWLPAILSERLRDKWFD